MSWDKTILLKYLPSKPCHNLSFILDSTSFIFVNSKDFFQSSHFVSFLFFQAHSCAVLNNGAIRCWGNNDKKQVRPVQLFICCCCFNQIDAVFLLQVGDGTTSHRQIPVDGVGLGSNSASVALGSVRLRNMYRVWMSATNCI